MLWLLVLGASLPGWGTGCVSTSKPGINMGTTNGAASSASSKFSSWFKASPAQPKSAPPAANRSDPTALSNKSLKPGAELYITMAQMREQAGETDEAEKLYQRALRSDSKSLGALLGYAHLQDRRGNLEAATKLYKKAVAKHPQEAAPFNDLGLCYHRRGMLNESVQALRTAVELQPDRKLYRNNLATVLVDLEQRDEALKQLLATGNPAAAHYNLGFLLHRKGEQTAALYHFRQALANDPSMHTAEQMIAKLSPKDAASERIASKPTTPSDPGMAADLALPVVVSDAGSAPAAQPPVAAHKAVGLPVSTRKIKPVDSARASDQPEAPVAPEPPQMMYADESELDATAAPGINYPDGRDRLPSIATSDEAPVPSDSSVLDAELPVEAPTEIPSVVEAAEPPRP